MALKIQSGLIMLRLLFLLALPLFAALPKVTYNLPTDPIDVVIPCAPKDLETLELCLAGIKKNGQNIRRIIVISKEKLTDNAEWFDERSFPFTQRDIALEIFNQDEIAAQAYLDDPKNRIGWIYQQLLKFYALSVIPLISPNVLLLDSDVVFLRPIDFIASDGRPYFNPAHEYFSCYFEHAARLLPDLRRVYPQYSGVSHHMPIQKPILDDLFQLISTRHQTDPWRALCRCIDHAELFRSPLSEYEIYFNFVLLRTSQATIRPQRWIEISSLQSIPFYERSGFYYVACHTWRRNL